MVTYDLLVLGEINPDIILNGVVPAFGQAETLVEDAALVIGSSSVITACGAARLGLRVAFAGVVGDDVFGRFMLEEMAPRGIDTAGCVVDPALSTGFSVILVRPDGDRAILTYPGAIPVFHAGHIDPTLLAQARHLHVGSYFLLDGLRPALPGLFREARKRGQTTSLDTNWDPSGRWDVAEILRETDVFLPNAQEVQAITGAPLDEGIERLAAQVPLLAVKLGMEGALAAAGGERWPARSLPIDGVVDTVGAGDSFNAGFLYSFLNGWTPAQALRLAAACGSLSTRAAGGTAAQPTLDEALAALAEA